MDIESIDARSFQTRSPSDFDNELNSIFGTNSNNNIDSNNLHAETPLTQISSTELYGPPECEFARIAFNSIPSIRNSKYIDELFNVFNAASSCVDVDRIRKYRIRLLRARGKLLDSCAVLDRQKVIEIFVMFIERNKRHTEHRAWLGSHLPSLDDNDIYYRSAFVNFKDTAASLRFKESLLEIPSLKGFETDIHKLAVLLWTPSPNGKENEVWDWISTVKKSLIARLQTIEEKTKWTMTIENQRYSRDKSFKDPVYDLTDQVVSDDEI
ncbi:hypothetical protein BDR26DRAFT_852428 [Obelidium mucronatum]|nr:hypothetical protein BDR26DRAFT_852428 [Obelidium mucronatum]